MARTDDAGQIWTLKDDSLRLNHVVGFSLKA
jgi:hypothetical protein